MAIFLLYMANHYELLAIVTGSVSDTEIDGVRGNLEELLKKHTSAIHYMHNLGRRKLAYPIKHQGSGTYLLCEFDADGESIKKLERALALTTEILRHCIVRRQKVGSPVPLERREEEVRPGPRRVSSVKKGMDEELLGAAPLEDVTSAPMPVASSDDPIPPVPAGAAPAVKEEPAEEAPASTAEEESKKKGKKASYEELDQKLNELLSDDII
jgi:small subunit ribosomal protein S6